MPRTDAIATGKFMDKIAAEPSLAHAEPDEWQHWTRGQKSCATRDLRQNGFRLRIIHGQRFWEVAS